MPHHTPGPWEAERIGIPQGKHEKGMMFRIIAPQAGDRKSHDIGILFHKPYAEEATANAHLIASAPDLVDALRHIHDLAQENVHSPQDAYALIAEWSKHALRWAEGRPIED